MVVVYDIEVLRNFFLYVDYNINTKEFHQFEISNFKNELKPLLSHLKGLKAQIGFNNIGYDAQIIQYIVEKVKPNINLSSEDYTDRIYAYSQYVIGARDEKRFADYRESDFTVLQLDLFKIWHYDNKARHCSLKYLQFSMDWHNIEDMPIDHRDLVNTRELADKVIDYCKNDVLSTYEFYKITRGDTVHPLYKGIDKVQLRKDIRKRFNFNCLNYSDVKIGDEINKQTYLRATGKKWKDIKDIRTWRPKFTFGECFPSYMEFETEEMKSFFEKIKNIYIDSKSMQSFSIKFDGVTYTMAKGGLHSKDKPRKIIPMVNQILRDADVGSMYPNAIIKRKLYPKHLGPQWLEGYDGTTKDRLEAKAEYKKTKDGSLQSITEALKLALNGGGFGKTGEPTNWQFDNYIPFAVTIGCQIDLLMLIEDLVMAGIRVLSANTDGVLCLFTKDQEAAYKEVCIKWEKQVGNDKQGQLEYNDYSLFAQMSVNSYIAIQTDGKVKTKDEFMVDRELHKNKSYRIIPMAIQAYYEHGIHPETFVKSHKNIFDFCAGVRANKDWHFEIHSINNGEYDIDTLSKTNRYYISNQGQKLLKVNKDTRQSQVDAGEWMCTIYNKHVIKPIEEYDINYKFYISEVFNIISQIEPEVVNTGGSQLSLFI